MVNSSKFKRLHTLHSWTGLLTGWFIFVVCFSGTVALFGDELSTWDKPNLRFDVSKEVPSIDLNTKVDQLWQASSKQGEIQQFTVVFPDLERPFYEIFINIKPEDSPVINKQVYWHPLTGETLPEQGKGASDWLVRFHRDLMLPNHTLGRTLVGIAGILMMLMIITGLIIHRKIIADLFQWHLIKKSLKMRFRSSHNSLAIWGVPFHLMIAFTGAFLGIVAILTPIVGVTAFKGDIESLQKIVSGEPIVVSGEYAEMTSLQDVIKNVEERTGQKSIMIVVDHWQDKNAMLEVFVDSPYKLYRGAHAEVYATTGEIDHVSTEEDVGIATHIMNSMTPLHYATYGGDWLKILYTFLGLSSSLLVASGLALWLERRQNGPLGERSDQFYEILGRLNIGITSGLVLASFSLLYWNRVLDVAEADRFYWNGVLFFSTWIASVLFSLLPLKRHTINMILLWGASLLLILLPLFDYLTLGYSLSTLLEPIYTYVLKVNVTAFIFGLSLAVVLYKLSFFRQNYPK